MNIPIQIAEIARIAEQLDVLCGDDDRCFHDMLICESNIDRIIGKLHEQIASDSELLAGIRDRETDLAVRKRRLSDRVAASKAAIGQFLRAAMLPKIELAEATYSVRDGKPKLEIVNPEAVPAEYQRVKTEPDKPAINDAFADVEKLPNWLQRSPAVDVVTARVR